MEEDYGQLDCILAVDQENPRDLHFSHITFEELISVQLQDDFCSEIHRRIDGGRLLRHAPTTTDYLSPKILAHKLSSLIHSSSEC